MDFVGSKPYTVGAEWELQLLDAKTLNLKPAISTVLDLFSDNEYVNPEFFQSCVELNSPIANHSEELRAHFVSLAGRVSQQCRQHGMRLAGAGTHPFCHRLALVTPLPRYSKLAAEYGYLAQTQIAFANHVHVGVPCGDEAMRTMAYLTPALPLLIAVTANSPFWRGHKTGFACYRRRLLAVSRSYGIPPYFSGWADFEKFFAMTRRAGSMRSIKDIHWDIRPHPDFGTLEFRVMDAQASAPEVALLAGFIRVLVAWAGTSSRSTLTAVLPQHLSHWIDNDNHYRATHHGLDAHLIADTKGSLRPIRDYLSELCEAIADLAHSMGESAALAWLRASVQSDPPYEKQQLVHAKEGTTRAVIADLATRFSEPAAHHLCAS